MSGLRAFYLTHPEVTVDPETPVTDWQLSVTGRARAASLGARLDLRGWDVVASAEAKAIETAWLVSGRAPMIRADMGENDRSATGFLPGPAFEATADAFFARPFDSIRGWESAAAAQARVTGAVAEVLTDAAAPVLFVGHGAVGTLLWCALTGQRIDRRHDQPFGGHWFGWGDSVPASGWQVMENLTLSL